jgi:hypothetical protein
MRPEDGPYNEVIRDQADADPITVAAIMRSKEFREGVADVRLGRPARYGDLIDDTWNYGRGRLWALIAPMRMPVMLGGRVNREAWVILARALADGTIL